MGGSNVSDWLVLDTDCMDDIASERVRLARERWQFAQDHLFAVLPPVTKPLAASDLALPGRPPAAATVTPLLQHAREAYADYLTELHRLHGG